MPHPTPAGRRPALELFLASGLVLFLELACIRWFPAHVLYLTFFTNAVLLAAFVGLSVGCLAARRPARLVRGTPALLCAALAAGLGVEQLRSRLETYVDVANQAAPGVVFFGADLHAHDRLAVRVPVELVAGLFFVLVAAVHVGPGQEVGRAFARVPDRTRAYTASLLGSLAGIGLFAACAWLHLPPPAWFAVVAVGVGYFLRAEKSPPAAAGGLSPRLLLVLAVALSCVTSGLVPLGKNETHWSPYYRIDVAPPNEVRTNLIGHQKIEPRGGPTSAPYALPYLFRRECGWPAFDRILVIGAGTGNDVARALAWAGPRTRIDAVEIDPVIRDLGTARHPDAPFADERVTVHLDDGRNFLRRAPAGEYDLVVYALIDSLVLHSGYSNIRLESYLFTAEAFRDVRRVLKPTGVFAAYNFFRHGWLAARLRDQLRTAFDADPVVLTDPPAREVPLDGFDRGVTLFFAGSPDTLFPLKWAFDQAPFWVPRDRPVSPATAARFAAAPPEPGWVGLRPAAVEESAGRLRPATDDWPFLYVREPGLPGHTLRGIGLTVLLSLAVGWWFLGRDRKEESPPAANDDVRGAAESPALVARAFLLGAGFMLVETKAVVQMALLFGSTWAVNTVVFAAVLAMSLAGNLFAGRVRPRRLGPYYAGLALALGLNVAVPPDAFLGAGRVWQVAGACILTFAPIAFAGVIFAATFGRARNPDRVFGANVAGALVGGLAENLSLVLGFGHLLLVAAALYLLSGLIRAHRLPTDPAPGDIICMSRVRVGRPKAMDLPAAPPPVPGPVADS